MTNLTLNERLNERIGIWAKATFGEHVHIDQPKSLGGHSGVTIGFGVYDGATLLDSLVLKMPPAGVARKNNFDVLRQVPLLQALEQHSIKAPRIKWWSDDEQTFGGPYLIMSRLRGSSPPDLFRPEAMQGVENAMSLFEQATDVLVDIHSLDVDEALPDWHVERAIPEEIAHWVKIFHKSNDPQWLELGLAVRDLLEASRPKTVRRGIVHGDYYSNNWVFDGAELSGVVDWEGTSIGPSLLDLGWLYMMYDPASWGPSRRQTMHWQPDPEVLVERYVVRSRWPREEILSDLPWYRALASYRLAAITAYYYEEHRSGRRPNDTWEMFAEAFPFLLSQASNLLRTL
ncbi:MAG: phosphotransferase family protein [Gammaproteobacteria bacterium]